MDQGLAAVWAGIAGLAGAGIGGAAAAWGAWIGGKKAVEAAERAEQRAAAAEHQHWLRQARYEAYEAFLQTAEEVQFWRPGQIDDDVARDVLARISRAQVRVRMLGPIEAGRSAGLVIAQLVTAIDNQAAVMQAITAQTVPPDVVLHLVWTIERGREFTNAYAQFSHTASTVLGQPPE